MAVNLKTLTEEELFYGAKTCQGCGALMACRMVMKVVGPKSCVAIPACCMAATTTVYPQSSLFVNNAVTAFPGLASTISGMSVGAEAMGWDEDTTFVAFGGDGGTVVSVFRLCLAQLSVMRTSSTSATTTTPT